MEIYLIVKKREIVPRYISAEIGLVHVLVTCHTTHHSASFGGKSGMALALDAYDDNSDPAIVVPRAVLDSKVACPQL